MSKSRPARLVRYLKKRIDFFAYTPSPVPVGGNQFSTAGFFGTLLLLAIVAGYVVSSIQRFVAQEPVLTVAPVIVSRPTSGLIPFSLALVNPELSGRPSTRRPALTLDPSYFVLKAAVTSAALGDPDPLCVQEATVELPLTICDDEVQHQRRTATDVGFCPDDPDEKCPSTKVCFAPSSQTQNLTLRGDCEHSTQCSRIEVEVKTCHEPEKYTSSIVATINYSSSYPIIPIPGVPPPQDWTFSLRNATSKMRNIVDATGGVGGAFLMKPEPNQPWGYVCNDGFDQNEAKAACRTLGLPTRYAWQLSPTSGLYDMCVGCQYYLDNSYCPRNATNYVSDCGYLYYPYGSPGSNCDSSETVGLYCGDVKPYAFEFKLVNSTVASKGRLMVRPQGTEEWSPMLPSNFSEADAMATCRALGYDVWYAHLLSATEFGNGLGFSSAISGKYYVAHSTCQDSINSTAKLDDCADILYTDLHQRIASSDEADEVAIDCGFLKVNSSVKNSSRWEYRLVQGTTGLDSTQTGRGMVQIRPNSSLLWGGVCNFDFNGAAAAAVCRSIGWPTMSARVLRAFYNKSIIRPSELYMESIRCAPDSFGLLEDCDFTYLPPGSNASTRSFDCMGSGEPYTFDVYGKHVSVFAFLDCNYACAAATDIQEVALRSGVQFDFPLTLQGKPHDIRVSKPIDVELDRWSTFTFSTYNTSVAPDYFFRWRTDHYSDIYLNSQSSNTRSIYLSPFTTGNNTAPRRVFIAQLYLSSTAYVETQSFQNLPDLIGSLYAFYASMFTALGFIFLAWNRKKFFNKNSAWNRIGPDFTVVPEDGGLEALMLVDGSFSKAKLDNGHSNEKELATVHAMTNLSFDPTAAVPEPDPTPYTSLPAHVSPRPISTPANGSEKKAHRVGMEIESLSSGLLDDS